MEFVWSNDKVFKLIELYQHNAILWDTSNIDYRHKYKKNEAWKNISTAIDVPKYEIETKIHTLRSQFARERKKMSSSCSSSKWMFYEALKFLLGVCGVPTITTTTITVNKTNENSADAEAETTSTSTSPLPTHNTSWRKEKRKIDDDLADSYEIVNRAKRKMDDRDEFDIYAQYVASELRAAKSEHAVLQAKYYINSILIDMRMGKLDHTQRHDTIAYGQYHRYGATSTPSMSPQTHDPLLDNIGGLVVHIKPEPNNDTLQND